MIFKNLQPTTYPPATPEQAHSCDPSTTTAVWCVGRDGGRGKLKANLGFTLIEMLVVIAIIGILYLIVFGSVSDSKKRGRDSKRIADISVIQLALERYYDQYKNYPITLDDDLLKKEGPIPTDPQSSSNYKYLYSPLKSDETTPCSVTTDCQSYNLNALLELDNSILKDDAILNNGLFYDVKPKF